MHTQSHIKISLNVWRESKQTSSSTEAGSIKKTHFHLSITRQYVRLVYLLYAYCGSGDDKIDDDKAGKFIHAIRATLSVIVFPSSSCHFSSRDAISFDSGKSLTTTEFLREFFNRVHPTISTNSLFMKATLEFQQVLKYAAVFDAIEFFLNQCRDL